MGAFVRRQVRVDYVIRSGDLDLVDEDGTVAPDGRRWLRSPTREDRDILERAGGPVLDVGCGPGRHTQALAAAGIDVLGIDLTPSILDAARRNGTPVIQASVFETLPRMGEWQTALLLDGNSGLGGNPLRLLRRLHDVLRPGGRILADVAPGFPPRPKRLRLRHAGALGPSFAWAPLHLHNVAEVAERADAHVIDLWASNDRWFCELKLRSSMPLPEQR